MRLHPCTDVESGIIGYKCISPPSDVFVEVQYKYEKSNPVCIQLLKHTGTEQRSVKQIKLIKYGTNVFYPAASGTPESDVLLSNF